MHECRKFEKAPLDAALGTLAPEREHSFTAHIAQCEPCRKAYEQARQFTAAVDRGVESLVAGEPSPHFAARLRARIANERPAPRSSWLAWKPAAAALALACILAVAGIVWIATHRNPAPTAVSAARETASVGAPAKPANATTVPKDTETNLQARPSPATLSNGRGESHRTGEPGGIAVARLVPPRHTAPGANSPAEPEVIVPPGQLEAVMQLAAAIRSGQIDGKQLLAAQKDMDKPIDIPPLEIKPIEIPPVDSEATAPSEPATRSNHH